MNDVSEPQVTSEGEEAAVETAETAKGFRVGAQGKVLAADKFSIDTTRLVPEFSHAMAEAFECSSDGTNNDCIALVLKARYPARHDVIKVALQTDIPGLIVMRTTAIVEWTPDNSERFAIIYRRPSGNPLYNTRTQHREPISEDTLRRNIIRPLFFALRTLTDRGVFHGNIRPENIFLANNENSEAVLGDCASSFAGSLQPALFETIERGMADPVGRGAGTSQDDIYAFGATVAVLFRGEDPLAGKSDKFVTEEKINRSSFNVLTDGLRLSPGLSEFLRATLNDDPKQRWTIDQVGAWVDGNRTTPKQTVIGQRAQRAMDFNGKKYFRPRLLARDLGDNIPEAINMIETGYLSKWLERAVGDHERLEVVNEAIARAGVGGRAQGYEDRLICFVALALDPRAPVRYKGVSVFPSGIGNALAYTMISGMQVQSYAELIRDRHAWLWLGHKENTLPETNDLLRQFDAVSKLIARRGINFGLERCVYELCPFLPCLSEMLRGHYVMDGLALLKAMNTIAPRNKGSKPIDRHIAAFISVRDSHDNSGLMSALDSGDKTKYSLAVLTLYQGLQKRAENTVLVELCEWLYKDAELVVQRYFNQNLKKEILQQLPKEMKSGNLRRMLVLVDNPLQVRKDTDAFQQAVSLYKALGTERDRMRASLDNNPNFGQGSGRHIAMVISAILSGAIISSLVLINFIDYIKGML